MGSSRWSSAAKRRIETRLRSPYVLGLDTPAVRLATRPAQEHPRTTRRCHSLPPYSLRLHLGRRRTRRGFTLVELLVAIALGSIMLTIVAKIFSQSSKVFSQSDAYIEIYQSARAFFDRFERDVNGIVPVRAWNTTGTARELRGVVGYNNIATNPGSDLNGFTDNEANQDVVGMLCGGANVHDRPLCWVMYYMNTDGELIRMQESDATQIEGDNLPAPSASDTAGVMALNVLNFQVQYFDWQESATPVWQNSWCTTGAAANYTQTYLPKFIQVTITISDAQDRIVRTTDTGDAYGVEFTQIFEVPFAPREQ